jgi:hypothetical protein
MRASCPEYQLVSLLVSVGIGMCPQVTLSEELASLECPPIMAHEPLKEQHPGWFVYSNRPLRLSGADIAYVVDSHYEATLEPDRVNQLNDDSLSTSSVFQLAKHRSRKPFSLVCHYGVHAQLSRTIPEGIVECIVVHHGRFGDEQGEFKVSCR